MCTINAPRARLGFALAHRPVPRHPAYPLHTRSTLPADVWPTQHSSQTTSSQSTIDAQAKTQLAELEEAVKKNRDGVIKKIVERVTKSEPQLHQNLKKVEA
jgi:hypothetical protein